MILSGQSIFKASVSTERTPMIWPFCERTEAFGMTYGVGPAGYDVRIEFDERGEKPCGILVPGGFILASTIERFAMPNDVVGFVCDKSSWARRGISVFNTVIEPGWAGWLTLEIANHSNSLIRIERGMPIAQVVFHYLDEPAAVPYRGKYQHQKRGPKEAI